jgi:cyclophilin family peptidyl-prolyl cis-trans isomerase
MGNFEIELFRREAPITTENFIRYVRDEFYDGLIFHRVIQNFVCQAGQYDEFMVEKAATYPPIQNEAGNGLSNLRGTIGMVRTSDPQSATCQFYINAENNLFLDHRDDTPAGYGYAVFGKVVSGMEVVDAINDVPTGVFNGFNDVPITPIVIEKITLARNVKTE